MAVQRLVMLALFASLIVTVLPPTVLAGPSLSTGPEGGAVYVVKVDCLRVNGSVNVNIILALPNPAYRVVESSWSFEKGVLTVNVTVERTTTDPVIQVIVHRGFSIELGGVPDTIVVYVNGSKVYSGSCGGPEASSSPEDRGSQTTIGDTTTSQPNNNPTDTGSATPETGKTSQTEDAGIQIMIGQSEQVNSGTSNGSPGEALSRGLGAALVALGVLLIAVAFRR